MPHFYLLGTASATDDNSHSTDGAPSTPTQQSVNVSRSSPAPLTTPGHIHERIPVITPRDPQAQWLYPTMTERDQMQHFINIIPEPNLVPWIIGKDVGSVSNNGPQLIELVA